MVTRKPKKTHRRPTLGREVAIKILPPDFASDVDRLARFDREDLSERLQHGPLP